eukprot:TRINITY_DN9865_c0_g1_i1.p1 TRINITY_DN9865_c0_g1~~TRINITY_DN9865_c0_g1_i1.p1  ORF type:complete len:507 (-),score=98.27 TRINITY_DN9865_c0_g1_i1:23-1543(-)
MEKEEEGLTINIRPQRKASAKERDRVNVLFSVHSPPVKVSLERPPMDLAVVLDRSGSMEGKKSEFAKKAIVELINSLGPQDRLHFVVYWDIIKVVFSDGNLEDKEKLINKVNKVITGGSTNISLGISKGFELLQRNTSNSLRRIFLFSDGIANAGTTSCQELFKLVDSFYEEGVTVSSFGLGEDYDEVIMRGIAERGSGDYFFIQSPENIPEYVCGAIQGLTRLIGTRGTFKLIPEGSTKTKICGIESNQDSYPFGDIVASETRNIVTEIETEPDPQPGDQTARRVATWKITYRTNSREPSTQELSGEVVLHFSDVVEREEGLDSDVHLAVKIKEFADKEREGKILYEAGKLKEVIELRKSYLLELKEYEDKDPSGRISRLIQSAQRQLINLEAELSESLLLSTKTPSEIEFYYKFGKFPPAKKRPLISSSNKRAFDSADWSLTKNGVQGGAATTFHPTPLGALVEVAVSPCRASTRKYFDSAEYMCRKDNTFNWKSGHIQIKTQK